MSPRPLAALAIALLAWPLASCETPPKEPFPEITFTDRPPIKLDAARIELVEEFVAAADPTHVEHLFPVAPAVAARRWVQDRLLPVGNARTVRVTLVNAGAIETPLQTKTGVEGFFTTEPERRYEVQVEMRIEILSEGSRYVESYARSAASIARTVPEDATLEERDSILYHLTEDTLRTLDKEFSATIERHLASYIR